MTRKQEAAIDEFGRHLANGIMSAVVEVAREKRIDLLPHLDAVTKQLRTQHEKRIGALLRDLRDAEHMGDPMMRTITAAYMTETAIAALRALGLMPKGGK